MKAAFKVEIQEWVGGLEGWRKALDVASGQEGRSQDNLRMAIVQRAGTDSAGGRAGWRSSGK